MYHHIKKLMFTVRVDAPDPRFGNMLLEQFGGANGELAAAMQYSIQGINCDDPACKDLLMDIGTEELSHLEVVGTLARMHLKPLKSLEGAESDPLIAIAGGGGVNLFNSEGNPWTADYLKITGELDVDLRSNIAAEARAKIVIPPTPGIVDQYYNDSTGEGDDGETDYEGPWNSGDGMEVIDSPALEGFAVLKATPRTAKTTRSARARGAK